jgi:RNA methyltransferase, TrmH family
MISSSSNVTFKRWLAARQRPERKTGELLLEGFHLLQAWTERFAAPATLVVAERFVMTAELMAWRDTHGGTLEVMSDRLFDELSSLGQFAGPLALVSVRAKLLAPPQASLGDLVFLDRIQDPGNLGTMLRSCAAFGVHQVALSPGTVWPWSAKVLRAGMSGHFSVDIHDPFEASALLALPGFQCLVTSGLDAEGVKMLDEVDLRGPSIWCFGNEGSGLSEALLHDRRVIRVSIPQEPEVESLNVASALAIALYEQTRQRRGLARQKP